jgi:kynurenine formamidase
VWQCTGDDGLVYTGRTGQKGLPLMAIYGGPDDAPPLTLGEFDALFRRLRDATAWGPDDRRGALNNLTPSHVLAAVGEVRSGHTRGVSWLEPGDHVTLADLEAAERAQQVRIGTGDVVFVRVGHRRRRDELGAWDAARARAGLHPTALLLLAERGAAALGSDGNNDTAPSITAGVDFPTHVLAINAMGLHLLDYLRFEELAVRCVEADRWSFLCVIAPLRLPSATGSPVNPIAIL